MANFARGRISLSLSLLPFQPLSSRATARFIVGDDIFPSYLAAEPGSSLRRRRSQDRVRGERRGRLVEQVRLRRGPSSGVNGRRSATGKHQGCESERKGRKEKKRERRRETDGKKSEEAVRKNNDKVI